MTRASEAREFVKRYREGYGDISEAIKYLESRLKCRGVEYTWLAENGFAGPTYYTRESAETAASRPVRVKKDGEITEYSKRVMVRVSAGEWEEA